MRLHVKQCGTLCTKCQDKPRVRGQRWCLDCRALYQREVYRPKHRKKVQELEQANFARQMQSIRRAIERSDVAVVALDGGGRDGLLGVAVIRKRGST